VQAVREVATAHPDGVPAPKALGRPITVRHFAPPPGEERALELASATLEPEPARPRVASIDLAIPGGEPNQTIDVATSISPSPEDTWELLRDFAAMSRCMPGVELDADEGSDTYSGHVRVQLGPMRLSFAGAARVLERDPRQRTLRAIASGRDASGGGVRADVVLSAEPGAAGGSTLHTFAKLYVTGRAAQFGRSLAGDVSRQLFAEFGACVERTLTTGEVAQPRRLAGGALAWRMFKSRVRELLQRLISRRQ